MRSRIGSSRSADHIPRDKLIVTVSRLLSRVLSANSNTLITLAKLKQIFPRLRVDVVDDSELPTEEARAYPRRWRIKIRKGIYEGLLRGDVRARWTLAHELAHVLLQHPRLFLSRPRKGDQKTQYELEANLFAATFLAPYEKAKNLRTMEEIRDLFQISAGSAASRLKELKRDERLRNIAKSRGVSPNSFSLEAGYCPELEAQTLATMSAITETIADFEQKSQSLDPLNSSILGISLFASAGADLLLRACCSKHTLPPADQYLRAATLAVAILILQPVRQERGARPNFEIIAAANEDCARHALSQICDLDREKLRAIDLARSNKAPQYGFEAPYLYALAIAAPTLIDQANFLKTLINLPNHRGYSEQNSLFDWELQQIGKLAEQLRQLGEPSN